MYSCQNMEGFLTFFSKFFKIKSTLEPLFTYTKHYTHSRGIKIKYMCLIFLLCFWRSISLKDAAWSSNGKKLWDTFRSAYGTRTWKCAYDHYFLVALIKRLSMKLISWSETSTKSLLKRLLERIKEAVLLVSVQKQLLEWLRVKECIERTTND